MRTAERRRISAPFPPTWSCGHRAREILGLGRRRRRQLDHEFIDGRSCSYKRTSDMESAYLKIRYA
jgi:hypothetical protein